MMMQDDKILSDKEVLQMANCDHTIRCVLVKKYKLDKKETLKKIDKLMTWSVNDDIMNKLVDLKLWINRHLV